MRILMAAAALSALVAGTGVAHAQSTAIEGRVDRLEREMRAVQRKVFPGGAGQTLEPQIVPETNVNAPGTPAGSALSDLTQRVAALENQVTSMTGQVEQGQYRLRQLEEAFNAYKRSTDARLKALEDGASSVGTGGPVIAPVDLGETPARPTRPPAETATPKPTGTRAQQVAAIQKPNSGDPAEDGYTYGFRLWSAKLYPEARRELEAVATKYPQHRRASYSQNLLGRAYLDSGAPSLAAVAFYENYKKNPNGERAADSLYYLAQALTKLKKPASEVCKVYTELDQLYGPQLSAEMKAGVAEGRVAQKCK
ncbi:YbgF trimerization domain-containing protein [Sphingomonas sp. HF-S4]|uniref:YbgF trimerization domain-containing protein n=1 Tax=Sphingomonas agrestis TaxID=3080540 RepID=A0ABU3Y9P0_9SPHN|nr:YbgF trimerization domain-containing protein [Sphingomonas sp. HF-S4]MDV3458133.1 YbgF trimerization domain-containing protein [Sphingomonas sp. HF-S4]